MTAPATDSLSGIVGRLTKAQRSWILGDRKKGSVGNKLHDLGITFYRPRKQRPDSHPRFVCELTPLGIAIRQHMEKES